MSKAMVARLRARPGAEDIGVTIGDFATTTVDESFSLVYLIFNTIGNLTTQAAQVACFRNAAAHLQPGGRFVIELVVPELRRLPPGETFRVFDAGENHWGIDEYDVATQGLISHHFELVDGSLERFSAPFPPCLAEDGTRSHGGARRDAIARALGRMDSGAVHEREPRARFGLGGTGRLACSLRAPRLGDGAGRVLFSHELRSIGDRTGGV